jgi:hypothetical protein
MVMLITQCDTFILPVDKKVTLSFIAVKKRLNAQNFFIRGYVSCFTLGILWPLPKLT